MKKFKQVATSLLSVVISVFLLVGCAQPKPSQAPAEEAKSEAPAGETKLKAAMLLSGPINDGGWNTDAYKGLEKIGQMGYEIAYTENVQQADIESILRDYAKKGYNLIIGHGFEYGDSLASVAKGFPEIKFLQIGGASENGTNLASGEFRLGELSYLVAKVAAKSTKTNKVGFVGAMEIPTIQAEVETIKENVPKFNPSAAVTVAYVGSWTDVNRGKEAAKAQINNGCDVIIGIGDACDAGAIQACEESGGKVKFIGWSRDFNAVSPDIVLTSGVQSVSGIVEGVGKDILDGKFEAKHKIYGITDGLEYLGTFSNTIDVAVKQEVLKDQEDIKAGKIELKKYN